MNLLRSGPVLLLALALPASLLRQDRQEGKKHSKPDTELAGHMEKVEDAAKHLRKLLKDESARAETLETLAEIESQTLACKSLVPAAAAKLPENERGAFVTAYRRSMVEMLTHQLELEAALLDGNAEAAKAAFERFRSMEDGCHERFAPDEDG